MGKRGIKKMIIALVVLVCFLGSIAVFFAIPYSKTHSEFLAVKEEMLKAATALSGVFSEEEISDLPDPVRRYFIHCGYIEKPKMSGMKIVYKNVNFRFGKGKPETIIDYTQYNIAKAPERIAYIDSSMYGVPFEGLDSYTAGKGSMKGVLGKLFTLFNQSGEVMDNASLVTFLSECLLLPSAALQDYITWEAIDALHAKATISCYGRTACGVFTFNEVGEMLSFTSDDREATTTDGLSEKVRWSVVLSDYQENNGIMNPTGFQAVWHYDDGDLVYFDGKDVLIEFLP